MKTHPHLLVRDSLSRLFLDALQRRPGACTRLDALVTWASGARPTAPGLLEISAEDGTPLFERDGSLAPRFAPLLPWMQDRARRYAAARDWLDGRVAEPLEAARAAWDAGLFFEVHELLEPVWLAAEGPRKQTLQGLIMAGAALHHLSQGNLAGARGLLREAARRLARAEESDGYALHALAADLSGLAGEIDAGSVRGPEDIVDPPRLLRSAPAPPAETQGHR